MCGGRADKVPADETEQIMFQPAGFSPSGESLLKNAWFCFILMYYAQIRFRTTCVHQLRTALAKQPNVATVLREDILTLQLCRAQTRIGQFKKGLDALPLSLSHSLSLDVYIYIYVYMAVGQNQWYYFEVGFSLF